MGNTECLMCFSALRGFTWRRVKPYVAALLEEECPVSLERTVVLASPHIPRDKFTSGQQFIQPWAAASINIPYTHEVCQSVVDTLLHIASRGSLRPHIPVGVWSWLHRQPSFPLVCWGPSGEATRRYPNGSSNWGPQKYQAVHALYLDSEIILDPQVPMCTSNSRIFSDGWIRC